MKNNGNFPKRKNQSSGTIFQNDDVHFRKVREMISAILALTPWKPSEFDLEHIVKVLKGKNYVNEKNFKTCSNCSSFITHSQYVFEVIKKNNYKDQVRGRQYNAQTFLFFVDHMESKVYLVSAKFFRATPCEKAEYFPIGTFKIFKENNRIKAKQIRSERLIRYPEIGSYENFLYLRNNAYKKQYRNSSIFSEIVTKNNESIKTKKIVKKAIRFISADQGKKIFIKNNKENKI